MISSTFMPHPSAQTKYFVQAHKFDKDMKYFMGLDKIFCHVLNKICFGAWKKYFMGLDKIFIANILCPGTTGFV